MTNKTVTPEKMLEQFCPLDGPHDPERLSSVLEIAAESLRRANHATLSKTSGAFASAPETYPAFGYLSSIPAGLEQLTRQLAQWAHKLAEDSTLRSDRTRDFEGGAAAALGAGHELMMASAAAKDLYQRLAAAHSLIGRLYHE